MTRQKSFKRLVRARMAKTGESYTTARTALLTAQSRRPPTGRRLDVRRGDPAKDRTGVGGVVRPPRRVARRRSNAHGDRSLGRRGARINGWMRRR